MFETPILFLVFNRPDTTALVLDSIKLVKPRKLFIAADGPRENREGDIDLCKRVRDLVIARIDWDCEVNTLFRENNLGCGRAVSEAISWFFTQVEEGIILEDDTLPNISFFKFCRNLLERYREDETIMHISGNNFQSGIIRSDGDYYFSKYSHIWGWATWKRAWQKYDYLLSNWPDYKLFGLSRICNYDETQIKFWKKIFDEVYSGLIDTWDYQWLFSIWFNKGVCVLPNLNLVINIGFREDATHTKESTSFLAKMKCHDIITFNEPTCYNRDADDFSFYNLFFSAEPTTKEKSSKMNFLKKLFYLLRK